MGTYPPEAWQRVGALLRARRGELGGRNRKEFARAGAVSDRPVYDLEEGRRTNFRPETIAQLERVYQLQPGAIEKALKGGGLDKLSTDQADSLNVIDHQVESGHMLIAIPDDLPAEEREVLRRWAERKAEDLNKLRKDD